MAEDAALAIAYRKDAPLAGSRHRGHAMTVKTDIDLGTTGAGQRKKRRFRRVHAIILLSLTAVLGGPDLYLNSRSFPETVSGRLVADFPSRTRGKDEIESFTWQLSTLPIANSNLTIHRRQSAN